MKKLFLLLFATFLAVGFATAQRSDRKRITIDVPVKCEACQKMIERYFKREPGIFRLQVSYHHNYVRAIYNPERTSASRIRVAITNLGFDADTLKANAYYQKRLPPCCRPKDVKSARKAKETQEKKDTNTVDIKDSTNAKKEESFLNGIFK